MRQLTLAGFTKRYVAALSRDGRTSIYALVREADTVNPRLREPLFVYAAANDRLGVLLQASQKTAMHIEYQQLADRYPGVMLENALKSGDKTLPGEYHKVWRSYVSERDRHLRDDRVKDSMRKRILELQKENRLSTYRICKDMGLNNPNINFWLKNGNAGKVKLDTARAILQYAEQAKSSGIG